MYVQRSAAEKQLPTGDLWEPRAPTTDGEVTVEASPGDLYAVVEAVAYDRVSFEIAPWPQLDRRGRLLFEEEPRFARSFPAETAQRAFDQARSRARQVERPLRVSDAFHVRGATGDLDEWEILHDVTRAAREVAKLALYAAIAPRLTEEEEEKLPATPTSESPESREGGVGPGALPAL